MIFEARYGPTEEESFVGHGLVTYGKRYVFWPPWRSFRLYHWTTGTGLEKSKKGNWYDPYRDFKDVAKRR